jgi:hypothetical protein
MPDKKKWWERPTTKGPLKKIREKIKGKKREKIKDVSFEEVPPNRPEEVPPRRQEDIAIQGIPNVPGVTKRTDYKGGGKVRDMFNEQYD